MTPWTVGAILATALLLLWVAFPSLRLLLTFGALGGGLWLWSGRLFGERSYPAGRSKAHGSTRELERRARAVEKWARTEELYVEEGKQPRMRSGWERFTEDCSHGGQSGLLGSTFLDAEAIPTGLLLRVELRPGGTVELIRGAGDSLASAMNPDLAPGSVTVEQDPSRVRVVLLKVRTTAPDLAPIPWPGPPRGASIYDPVRLGVYLDADGGPLEHPLFGQHVLIAGASGSGKSVTLNIEVAHVAACRDAVMVGCDLKGGAELGPWERHFLRLATTRAEAEELLEWVVANVLEVRGPQLKARGVKKWPCTPDEPAYVVVVDEHSRLSYSKPAAAAVVEIMERGRALGVIYVGCLQKPLKDALGSNRIGPNMTVRISHRVATTNEVGVALFPGAVSDGWAAHEIPKDQQGALYLHGPGAEYPRLGRSFLPTDAQITEAVRQLAVVTPRPELRLVTPPAGAVPTQPTNREEPDGSGGGETALLAALPARLDDLADTLDTPRTTVYRRLRKLRAAGRVENRDGVWEAVP